jgi:hypothetical protein
MAEVLPLPRLGELFLDARDGDRTMRVSHHPERGVVVVSLWSGLRCRASFQLPIDEVARLSDLLGTVRVDTSVPDGDLTGDESPTCGLPCDDLPQAG